MKTSSRLLLAVGLSIIAPSFRAAPAEVNPEIVERGPHHKRWERSTTEALPNGRNTTRTSGYTEMAVGMHYWSEGQWREAREEIELFQDGAVARQGQHQVIFAPNIATLGAIALSTPEGHLLRTHVLGLAVFDTATGQSELVAEVQDSIGELHPPNVVIYPDAFTDVKASLRYTYNRDRFEQDVILFERLPLPAGFNPATTRLEIWTEVVDAPAPIKTVRAIGSLQDETLDFGVMKIGSGRAFALEDPQGAKWATPMCKTWTRTAEGRTFLIEAVEFQAVEAELNKLPAPAQGAAVKKPGPARQMAMNAAGQRFFPQHAQAAKAGGKIQMAAVASRATKTAGVKAPSTLDLANTSRGLVLDYSIVQSTNGFRFQGDATYFISGSCTLSGTNILEGGAVIKSTNGVTLSFTGPIECRTSAYLPAVFTSWCDNTVGETITGSTGNPWTNYAAAKAVYFDANVAGVSSTLSHLRVAHADIAFEFYTGRAHELKHIQVVHCARAFSHYYASASVRNVLAIDCGYICGGSVTSTSRVEHATFSTVGRLSSMGSYSNYSMFLTNSLLVAVTNSSYYTSDYLGAYNASNSNPAAVFQTVGAGTAYLLNNTYRNFGTTNIDASLLTDLRQRTTYPPVILADQLIVNPTTLSPQAQRDTDLPDCGYHYAPLDFALGNLGVSNTMVLATGGVALGTYSPAYAGYGLGLHSNAVFVSEGSATALNRIVRYNTVQEQANTNWTAQAGPQVQTIVAPQARFRFTDFAILAQDTDSFRGYGTATGSFPFQDCSFAGGRNNTERPHVYFTNCFFQRVNNELTAYSGDITSVYQNCTFQGGQLYFENDYGVVQGSFYNNVFDATTIVTNDVLATNSHNAYTTNLARLVPYGASTLVLSLTNVPFAVGAYGRFYLPGTGVSTNLFNAGTTNAQYLALYHYTTTTNQVKETNSMVDLGFHALAVNGSGPPNDTDGDGVPDYLEDVNGNGIADVGEGGWQTYNSALGVGAGPGLLLFTPLK